MSEAAIHQLRLSIDIKSIKDHEFTAQLYVKYNAIHELGIDNYRSSPTLSLNNQRIETQFKDCFGFYYFQTNSITSKIRQILNIQVWHSDRLKKDIFLGVAQLNLQNILNMPLRVTSQSYARVLDAYVPVDEVDENNKPIKTIASLRVIVYLQDMGPADQLQKKGFNLKDFVQTSYDQQVQEPKLPSQNRRNYEEKDEGSFKLQLNQLETKVVWQLQTWKKAQEAKTRITLKQKEIQFWTNLSEQQRKSDLEKQKQFKKMEANLNLLENKVKSKMNELIKRQQKIITLQQQLQSKITEVSKQCLSKDEEIERIKRKSKQQKTGVIKQKSVLQIEIAKLRAQNAKLRVELQEAKKEDQKSPLSLLRNELNNKIIEIKELSKQLQKANQIKQQYKIYYGKMKDELIITRQELKQKQESLREIKHEKQMTANELRLVNQQLGYERQQKKQYQRQQFYQRPEYQQENEDQYMSDRDKWIRKRQQLITKGNYSPHDDLIKELDKRIAGFS